VIAKYAIVRAPSVATVAASRFSAGSRPSTGYAERDPLEEEAAVTNATAMTTAKTRSEGPADPDDRESRTLSATAAS
jgi:hypothetical protein